MSTVTHYTLRPITPADRALVTPILVREWGATEVVALSIGGLVDAVTEARKQKPQIPERGLDDIPIRDELEPTMELQ